MTRWLGPVLLVLVAAVLVHRVIWGGMNECSLRKRLESRGEAGAGPYWHRDPGMVPYARGGCAGNAHVGISCAPINPPEAKHVVPAPWVHEGGRRYLEVAVLSGAAVLVDWARYTSGPNEGRGLSPDVRRAVTARFRELLLAPGVSRPAWKMMRLDFDRFVRWGMAASVLAVAARTRTALERVGFRVAYPPHGSHLLLQADLGEVRGEDASASSTEAVRLALVTEGEWPDRTVVAHLDQDEWSLPDDPWDAPWPYGEEASPALLEEANRTWARIDDALGRAVRGRTRAFIRVPDRRGAVPVGHVVLLLDLLLGHGVRHVEFPDDDVALDLVPPPAPLEVLDPAPPEPEPVVSLPLVFLAVLGSAGVLTLSLRGTGRTSGRPSGSSGSGATTGGCASSR